MTVSVHKIDGFRKLAFLAELCCTRVFPLKNCSPKSNISLQLFRLGKFSLTTSLLYYFSDLRIFFQTNSSSRQQIFYAIFPIYATFSHVQCEFVNEIYLLTGYEEVHCYLRDPLKASVRFRPWWDFAKWSRSPVCSRPPSEKFRSKFIRNFFRYRDFEISGVETLGNWSWNWTRSPFRNKNRACGRRIKIGTSVASAGADRWTHSHFWAI